MLFWSQGICDKFAQKLALEILVIFKLAYSQWQHQLYNPLYVEQDLCINLITGKPVLTDTRDRRTLTYNGQFLKVPNIFFIFYCNLPFNKRTLPYPYNGQCL